MKADSGTQSSSSDEEDAQSSTTSSALARTASWRRNKIQEQAAFDRDIFNDQSLGCPLASFDLATLALVGGKALQCWKLTQHGFPLPCSYVIPTYVYSMHIQEANVSDTISEVFASDLRSPEGRPTAERRLEEIRTRILQTPLNPQCVENLQAFLNTLAPGTFYAVRSSGTSEDSANQSFAGQYGMYSTC